MAFVVPSGAGGRSAKARSRRNRWAEATVGVRSVRVDTSAVVNCSNSVAEVGAERVSHGIPGQVADVRGLRRGVRLHCRRTEFLPGQAIQKHAQTLQGLQAEARSRAGQFPYIGQAG